MNTDNIICFILAMMWGGGVVIAEGIVSVFSAIIFPFWAWYLTIEHFMVYFGVL